MNYHNITHDDMLNGDGLRTVLWVSGCTHHCKECQNPITWDPQGGITFDEDAENELFSKLSKDYISGITFSGGDPLHPNNRETILRLAKRVREELPEKTIWLYTGYLFDDIKTLDIIKYLDVIVDGKYVEKLRDITLKWRGSSNQRVIDVTGTRKINKIVLHEW